ncbi:thiamine ABC transporter substrate binding subunit [Salinispirillum sp. LH 10-3-1]|uniref:Thiamine-binding periplasmic protein n=1 Tax=Salinispirillum sp. LH 10-3-1 TaxID=2952525 RepID=A0AB38YDJ7_9GAMM
MKFHAKPLSMLLASAAFALPSVASELTVYTYSSFTSSWGPGPQIKAAFEAQCDCTLTFVSSDDGVSLLNRVRLEGANTQADVILGIDDALIAEARALGVVQPHSINWGDYPMAADLAWSDDTFVPFDYGYFAFVYDSETNSKPVTSLDDLLRSNVTIVYQDPRTSTVGQGLMLWMNAVYGDDVGDAWGALAERTVTVTSGWSAAYGMFLEGEADYVLSYTTSPAYHVVAESTDRYKALAFSEGHVAQIEVGAISAHTQQPELAEQFLTFLLSKEAQEIIPVTNWMLPVRTDVDLPEVFSELAQPERIGFTAEEVYSNRQKWIREWRNAVSQ